MSEITDPPAVPSANEPTEPPAPTTDDASEDIAKLQAEIERMEAEAAALDSKAPGLSASSSSGPGGAEATGPTDANSIYVGAVDYSCTPEDLVSHFSPCGPIERVTIQCDKFTGNPKGYAYVEFKTEEAMEMSLKMDGSELKGRAIKVNMKRVNEFGHGGRGG
eukprot:CAMPEP_0182488292 /NCGR_PEP_ID=MMETSP1319-20130603/48332_1 /TAXON_ID=172717 /ORGANISM="Bolidomonas pacifica, Strain RCC208" /LENGTH=162 /DNA_ID=CAMNT_0024690419 /DNA_START=664 /DNA_END=1148 /DNA_ORIENTATION=+